MSVRIGEVNTFVSPQADAYQASKVCEEAVEVLQAVLEYAEEQDDFYREQYLDDVLSECCDVIQATCNLVAALGISDLRKEMRLCRKRNEMRGRSYGA